MKTPDSDYFALHHYNPPPKTSLPRTTKIKAALLGAQNAGKTSIIRRYFDCTFDSRRAPTLGSDFFSRKVPLKKKSSSDSAELTKDDIISFQVWDTPGRERFAANRKIKFTAAFPDR
jgi:small GTP-binding protein